MVRPEHLPVRALAWRIDCDNRLAVTIAVVDRYILLLSKDGQETTEPNWRMGSYMDPAEASKRAVEMTGSYERLRHGRVNEYAELTLPAAAWKASTENDDVNEEVKVSIEAALSPAVSPS